MPKELYKEIGKKNVAEVAWLRWLALDDAAQQEDYKTYRKYFDGQQGVELTDRMKQYLQLSGIDFRSNFLRLPVQVLAQRFRIIDFSTDEEIFGGNDGLLWQWWEANRMDGMQNYVTEACMVDGDTFILIEWDEENNRPKFWHERAFDGNEGVKVHYQESARQKPSFASKRWRVVNEDGSTNRRLNIYTKDKIYKYIMDVSELEAGWVPFVEDGEQWPLDWPLGFIPIVHFRHNDNGTNWGRSELEDLISDQEALNKSIIDILETGDKTAYQLITLSGGLAVDKDGDPIEVQPRQILSHKTGNWGHIPAGDIDKLRTLREDFIISIAQKSQIPLQYFQVTGQIAAADTQRADDSNLVARARWYSVPMGNSWEDVMRYALAIGAEYGNIPYPNDLVVKAVWDQFERIDPMQEKERQAKLVKEIVTSGGSLAGALKFAEVQDEIADEIIRSDVVGNIEQ